MIEEIEIITSGATAEYGRADGGFANIISKSGGNDFEGSFKVFWFSRLAVGAHAERPIVGEPGFYNGELVGRVFVFLGRTSH